MKSKGTRQTQLLHGLTRMTKRERKATFGYGRSGNESVDAFRKQNGLLADNVKDRE